MDVLLTRNTPFKKLIKHFNGPVRFVIALIITELASDVSLFIINALWLDRVFRSDGRLITGADTMLSLNMKNLDVISVIPVPSFLTSCNRPEDLITLRVESHG